MSELAALELVIADAESDPRTPFDTLVRLWTQRGAILNARIPDDASVYGPVVGALADPPVICWRATASLAPGQPCTTKIHEVTCEECRRQADEMFDQYGRPD